MDGTQLPTASAATTATFAARVPVELHLPEAMRKHVAKVLDGEYDAPLQGTGLTILDVGANVGAFTVWADLRWPGSTIHAYEPHPGTARMLRANVGRMPRVRCVEAAVFPTSAESVELFSRFDGDGESGLVGSMASTWREMPAEGITTVPVVHPRALPQAEVVKVDCEGSEADVVEHLDLSRAELVMVEYQNDANRDRVLAATGGFRVLREERHPWEQMLDDQHYRRELAGDHWGVLVLVRGELDRLRPIEPALATEPEVGLGEALRRLPGMATAAARRRLKGSAGRGSAR